MDMIMTPAIKPDQPRGMVLIFVLCVLAILAILCTSIFLSTRDELQVSADNSVSRDAFTKADLTARLAVFLSRTALYGSPGDPIDSLKSGGVAGRPEFEIEMIDKFGTKTFQKVGDQMTDGLIKQRYIWAVSGHPDSTYPEDPEELDKGDVAAVPHVAVYYKYAAEEAAGGGQRQLVGTAAVAYGRAKKTAVGSQREEDYKQGGGGAFTRVFLIVTADGRVPVGPKDKTGQTDLPVDPSNYLLGDDFARHSIITTIYKEILQ